MVELYVSTWVAIIFGILGVVLLSLRVKPLGLTFMFIAGIAWIVHIDRRREWHSLYEMRKGR